jgi:hypothetical protein
MKWRVLKMSTAIKRPKTFGKTHPYLLVRQDLEFEQELDDDYGTTWYVSADIYYSPELDRHKANVFHIGTYKDTVEVSSIPSYVLRELEMEALVVFYEESEDINMVNKYMEAEGIK